jgi:glycosyltransferase involved in cell wall biosynthesis
MNIGLVIISAPGGGSETVVYNLQNYLSKKGHKVTLIANEEFFAWDPPINCDKINLKHLLDPNFLIKRIFGKRVLPKIILKKKVFTIPILLDIYFRKEIKHIIREINYKKIDVLHFHDPYGLKLYKHLSKISDIPSIYTFHGKDIDLPYYIIGTKHNFTKIINSIDGITAVSKSMKDYLISNRIKSNIDVIYNGFNLESMNSILINKQETNDNKEELKLIFPGGMKNQKGGEILLDALKEIKNTKYKIKLFYCGRIDDQFAKNHLDENIIFKGLLSQYEYLTLLSKCDCLILLSKWESFSISILEAMALGKTVITTSVGGIPELVYNNTNGFFVQREPKDVADKIIYLYKNPELQRQISRQNLRDAKKLDWNKITDQYIDLYQSIAH